VNQPQARWIQGGSPPAWVDRVLLTPWSWRTRRRCGWPQARIPRLEPADTGTTASAGIRSRLFWTPRFRTSSSQVWPRTPGWCWTHGEAPVAGTGRRRDRSDVYRRELQQPFLGGGAALCGIPDEREPRIGRQFHDLKSQRHSADDGMIKDLDLANSSTYIVGGP
jgi:hypothetical protein